MFLFMLCFLYSVAAQQIYSRTFLRGLKWVEDERIQTEWIDRGIVYITDAVFNSAKQGLLHYTTEPFEGCDIYIAMDQMLPFDKHCCEIIVHGIRRLVSERFPDTEVTYDINQKRYTLRWD